MESVDLGGFVTLVSIQQPTVSRGSQGERLVTYSQVAEVYGELTEDLGESLGDDNFESVSTLAFTTYKVDGLTTRWRAVIDNKAYDIINVEMINRMSPYCRLTLRALDA